MGGNVSSFDFVLSAGVDTTAIKQDILKAYKDVQVNINGQKLTISNITIDSKNALESFKNQINKIGLSNGIKIEIDTQAFKNASAKISEMQSLLDRTNLKSIDQMFQKSNGAVEETFKTLTKDIQISKQELNELNAEAEKLYNSLRRKSGSLDEYQDEYILNQKLYQVMQNQIASLKQIQSTDGWNNNVESLSQAYQLLKSIESIQSRLKNAKYSDKFTINTDSISSLDANTIKEKYNSLASGFITQIRGQEQILRNELNGLIQSWIDGTQKIEGDPLTPEINNDVVKERITELEGYIQQLKAEIESVSERINTASLGVGQTTVNVGGQNASVATGLSGADSAISKAQNKFDLLIAQIKQATTELIDLKIRISDFSGLSDIDLNNKFEEAGKTVGKLTKQIEQLDATKVDISGLSDDDIIKRIREVNSELTNMVSGKTGPQKAQIVVAPEYQNLLAQFKQLYTYAQNNNLTLNEANLGIKDSVLNARIAQTKNIVLYNEEAYNSLIAQRTEQQSIIDKCQEELRLRQNINAEQAKISKPAQTTVAASPASAETSSPSAGSSQTQATDSESTKPIKLVPDTSTFKADVDAASSAIPLDKAVKLIPDTSTFKEDSDTVLGTIPLEKQIKLVPDTSTFNDDTKTFLDTVAIDSKQVKLTPDASTFKEDTETTLSAIQLDKDVKVNPIQDVDFSSTATNEAESIDTIKAAVLELTQAIGDKTLAITQEKIAMDVAAQGEVKSIQDIINKVEELTNKIAILKGVVDNIQNIKVEILENNKKGQPNVKVNGRPNQPENVALSSVLKQTQKDYDAIAAAARKANPEIGETLKIVQKLRRDDYGKFAQSFVVSDANGNSATVNKDGKYYLGTSVVRDDIAEANAEQKALNASIKEYEQHLKEIQTLDAKNSKTRESNATYLLSEQLKSMEKIAKIKADIINRESSGKDTSVLEQKLFLEKQYCNALTSEMELYKGTIAYQERISAVKNKSKETELIVDDAKVLAEQKASDAARKNRLALRKKERKQAEAEAQAEAQAELQRRRQDAKEEEARAKAQQKKWQAFQREQQEYVTGQYETEAIERNKKANQELLDTIQRYSEVSKRISSNKALDGDLKLAAELEAKISELQKQPILSKAQIEESERRLSKLLNQLVDIENKINQEEVVAESERARNVAEEQKKYEEDLYRQRVKNRDEYVSWWSKEAYATEGKQLSSDYSSLENVLSQKNALLLKSDKNGGLSTEDQQKLNDLLNQENKLRNSINEAYKLGITNKKAYVHLIEREKALQDTLSSSVYKNLENTLIDIDKLRIKESTRGLSTEEQLKLNKLLEEQVRLEALIEDYQKRGIKNAEAELSLHKTEQALKSGSSFNVRGGNYSEVYAKKSEIDASKYIDTEDIVTAQVTLKTLYDTMTNGAKRSAVENEKLEKDFKEQIELINKLTQASKLRVKANGEQYITSVKEGQTIEQSRDEILSYIQSLNSGNVTFETFTKGQQGMIISVKGADNQIRKYKVSLDQATGAVSTLYLSEKKYTNFGQKWIAGIKRKLFELSQYMSGISLIMKAWNSIQNGINIVRELDTALTEMRKVSDETVTSLERFQKESFDIANSVGATATTIQNSTASWMRLGESMEDAAESARVANVLLNVSEFDSIDAATDSLVSMSQAYKELDKIDIVDKLNNVGNNFAISTDGLASALQKSASALKTAGNDMNEAIALTTAGNAIAQDPDSVGAGLRTISLRLVGTKEAKEELESLGEEADDVITTTSKLRDTILSATKAATADGKGFDIIDDNGNYKSTYEIMQGLADIYDEIVAKDKELGTNNLNLLLETIAGKNRSNIAASILQSPDVLRDAFESAKDSAGSAQEELEKYLDSIDGKITKLKNNVQEFWATFLDTDVIKGITDTLSGIIQGITWITENIGSVGTVTTAALSVFAIKNSGGRAKALLCYRREVNYPPTFS